ncbi:2Fe-2S iron-sulfur cluster-binding protein [Sphingomonas rubra]|uniref:Ferredoxin n=1 Tax=Sphingomonas rubra TaxID=634430 RepID=A0A1I5SW66_9SPHN|nr:2Fe-2S iron-sulfur cluster-binding protein [Sphingomonas rubra]SFP74968.1 Ferredoxin [Sphingomonas rubra]
MIRVRFETATGIVEVEAAAGDRLLDVAQAAGQPLEGTCGGQLACATCHLIVAAEDWSRLPPPRPEEEDMLDLVPDAVRTSRLSCQIRLTPSLDGLALRVP